MKKAESSSSSGCAVGHPPPAELAELGALLERLKLRPKDHQARDRRVVLALGHTRRLVDLRLKCSHLAAKAAQLDGMGVLANSRVHVKRSALLVQCARRTLALCELSIEQGTLDARARLRLQLALQP